MAKFLDDNGLLFFWGKIKTWVASAISGKADKATTLSGYGITDAKIASGVITLGSNTITPLTSHQDISGKANLASPAFTGTPTAPTATAGTNTTQIATTAFVKNAVETAVTGAAAYQGVVNTGSAISSLTDYKAGWYWVIGTSGTYVGETCEVGDMIFCKNDYSSAYSASDFDVVQTNLDLAAITNAEIDTIVAS